MTQKEFLYEGKSIFYRVKGEGPAVVLIHGFGEDGHIWKNQWPVFERYLLIVPDLPGSGRSGPIQDMSMEGLAACLRALMEQENIQSATLIGHSMGGYIVLSFAEQYPALVKGLGLFHSTAYADNEVKKATRRKGIGFIGQNGAHAFLKTTIPTLYSPFTQNEKKELVESHLSSAHAFRDAALIAYYESMIKRPDRTQVLKDSAVPVLFVMGRFDAAVPLQDGLQQSHLPEVSYIHILEKSGHMGMMEEPEKSNQILLEFTSATNNNLSS